MLRRSLLAFLGLALFLDAVLPGIARGQQKKAVPPPPLPAPPSFEPRAIVARLLNAYLERRMIDLSRFPLVHRLEQALARSDLGDDPVLGRQDFEKPESQLDAFRILSETIIDEKRRSIEVWLKRTARAKADLTGSIFCSPPLFSHPLSPPTATHLASGCSSEQRLSFDFDLTSGDWLIFEIRDEQGYSLRRDLQVNR